MAVEGDGWVPVGLEGEEDAPGARDGDVTRRVVEVATTSRVVAGSTGAVVRSSRWLPQAEISMPKSLDDANDLFIGCVCQAIPRFDACTGGCQPTAGRCVLTQKCVGACRSKASAFRQSCLKEARRNIRAPEQSDPSGCGADNTKCNIG